MVRPIDIMRDRFQTEFCHAYLVGAVEKYESLEELIKNVELVEERDIENGKFIVRWYFREKA